MAEHVDYTSLHTTRWTFRTFNVNVGIYVEWGAESIREKPGGFWGWERRGAPRPFTLELVYPNGVLMPMYSMQWVPWPALDRFIRSSRAITRFECFSSATVRGRPWKAHLTRDA
jgi:hypothetical protein